MFGVTLLLSLMAALTPAPDYLAVVDADYRDVQGQAWLDRVDVMHMARDHMIVRVGAGAIGALPAHTVLDRGDIAERVYLSAQLRDASGRETAARLGTVLLERDGRLLIRQEGDAAADVTLDGIQAIVPLRVMRLQPAPGAPPLQSVRDDLIPDIVAAVDQTAYMDVIQDLEDFFTRNARTTEYYDACVYAHDVLESYGVTAEIEQFLADPWWGESFTCYNVVGEKPGTLYPDQIYIICGHLDSTAGQPSTPETEAPGADDNGSGSAAVLEAARILSAHDFNCTIRFICFGAEEQGLCGSEVYANAAAAAGDNILGVINLDMLLYGPYGHDTLEVFYDTQSEALAQSFGNMAATYVPDLDVLLNFDPGAIYSDHSSFWNVGYAAIEGIEEYLHGNPNYHTTGDVLGNYLEFFPFGTNCFRAALATLASLAQPSTGTGVDDAVASAPEARLTITRIAPNPARDLALVGFSSGVDHWVDVTLYDTQGRAVRREGLRLLEPGRSSLDLELADLPSGVYFLRAAGERSAVTRKLTITR